MKVQRNDPCPCGSGRKYKKCCGIESATLLADTSKRASPESLSPAELGELAGLFKAGDFPKLEARARDLSAREPPAGLAWKLLGIALAVQGKDAIPTLQKAVELLPDDAEVHNNLGNALNKVGRSQEAAASCRRALQIDPQLADACNNLGNALRGLKEPRKAISSYRQALQRRPYFSEAHNNIGNALMDLEQLCDAVDSYRQALRLNPSYAQAHSNLGSALLQLGRLEEAVDKCRDALRLRPDYAEACNNLGNALLGLGRYDEAVTSYRRALQLKSEFPEAYSNLGNALLYLDRAEEAMDCCRRALQIRPQYVEALNHLAFALRHLGRINEAEEICRRALDIDPKSASSVTILGELRAGQGQFAEAEALYRRAMMLDPDSVEAWSELPKVRRMTLGDIDWHAGAKRLAGLRNLPPRKRASVQFALAKYFDDLKQFEQAFEHYRCANELRRRYSPPYEPQRHSQGVDQIMRTFDQSWLQSHRIDALSSQRPVFIVGMPRSGTTLAEQILASHPAVFGAGELTFWSQAAASLQAHLHDDTGQAGILTKLSSEYLQKVQTLSAQALRVIDKMPANFQYLGLIHAALPRARIIHMQRNPVDTCLSIYFQNFSVVHPYACDLQALAHYYGEYRRLMEHWRRTLPADSILEVPYEGLVIDQEAWSRRMLEFIGLPWDPRCLDFHQTQRSVITASVWQVRQKISSSSVDRWRHYESFVAPLLPLMQAETNTFDIGSCDRSLL